ncbi:energy transducer TonB [Methylophaga sulfidovorans]|uniref:Protein TonB n=1 Tax=Methylophaga sulfidovorans TaxID=45496 RepID=A0A1I3TZL4_9GAMM|nr:energy transducer TonB [Methylophaga sulfidovorans]SFJ76072.1 outer membrane transport energization protein TonB [Methylophaga sulfidovorans]
MRLVVGIVLALLVNFGLFYLMEHMTNSNSVDKRDIEQVQILDFVRLKKDEVQPETKKRELPKKPPPPDEPPPPPEPTPTQANKPDAPTPEMDIPAIDVPMNITGGPYLGDFSAAPKAAPAPAPSNAPMLDNEVVPLVRIPPKYPRVASRRGIEGVVTVTFIITKDGRVRDPKVIKAEPATVFNDAALKAILKWKFKPKLVDGQAVERQATQEIEFKLSR